EPTIAHGGPARPPRWDRAAPNRKSAALSRPSGVAETPFAYGKKCTLSRVYSVVPREDAGAGKAPGLLRCRLHSEAGDPPAACRRRTDEGQGPLLGLPRPGHGGLARRSHR